MAINFNDWDKNQLEYAASCQLGAVFDSMLYENKVQAIKMLNQILDAYLNTLGEDKGE